MKSNSSRLTLEVKLHVTWTIKDKGVELLTHQNISPTDLAPCFVESDILLVACVSLTTLLHYL